MNKRLKNNFSHNFLFEVQEEWGRAKPTYSRWFLIRIKELAPIQAKGLIKSLAQPLSECTTDKELLEIPIPIYRIYL